jgi:hypothetical protein
MHCVPVDVSTNSRTITAFTGSPMSTPSQSRSIKENPIRSSTLTVFCLLALAVLIGCSRPVRGSHGIGGIQGTQVQIAIVASDNCAKQGKTVKLVATVTNLGDSVLTIQLENKPVLDIQVRYETLNGSTTVEGKQRWSDGKALTPELVYLQLQPGESKTIEMDWIAQPPTRGRNVVDAQGILQYGVNESDVAIAHAYFSVDFCP